MGVLFGWGLDGLAPFARPPIPQDPRVQAPGLIAPLASSAPRPPPPGPSHLSPPRCCQCPAACSRVDPARLGWGEGGWWAALLAWLFACLPLRGCPPAQLSPPPVSSRLSSCRNCSRSFYATQQLSLTLQPFVKEEEGKFQREAELRALSLPSPSRSLFRYRRPVFCVIPFFLEAHTRAQHTHTPPLLIFPPVLRGKTASLACLLL